MTKKVNFSTRSQLIRGSLRYLLVSNVSKFIFNNTTENNTFINNINVKN